MRKMRKLIAVAAAILMLAGLSMTYAAAESPEAIHVNLRIEGVEETLFYEKNIQISAGATIEDLMLLADDMDDALEVVVTTAEWGDTYISAIAGLGEFDYGGYSGWLFRVNGVEATAGMGMTEIFDGDSVVFFYNDAYGDTGMQYPFPDLSRLYSCSVIIVLSEDVVYDEDWNMSLVLNPVEGAAVTFGGSVYTTDENGEIQLDSIAGVAGMQSMQIERYDEESGIPTVLRLAPDFEMYVPFADTPDDEWYEIAVMYSVRAGFFVGIDAELNIFAPQSITTMAQLITILGRVAGEVFNGDTNPWYREALEWAVENGIIDEEGFVFDAAVTREMFVYMFYLTASKIGSYDMEVRADISGAVDYDEINENYLDAVSWAVATELIRGTSSDALTINPIAEINRAEVCQMLLNFMT